MIDSAPTLIAITLHGYVLLAPGTIGFGAPAVSYWEAPHAFPSVTGALPKSPPLTDLRAVLGSPRASGGTQVGLGVVCHVETWTGPDGFVVPPAAFRQSARYTIYVNGLAVGVVQGYKACDQNLDGFVDGVDADLFAGWFESGDRRADFNADGFVDGIDSDLFNNAFNDGGPVPFRAHTAGGGVGAPAEVVR